MGKIIDLYANRKFLEQARALGLTYSAYYDLVIEKGIHIEVALENAKRGITLENYLSMQNQTKVITDRERKISELEAVLQDRDAQLKTIEALRKRRFTLGTVFSSVALGIAAILVSLFPYFNENNNIDFKDPQQLVTYYEKR
ncbi:hypothetical protein J4230_04425 [Candidatus Woesearchaeota archaeon]|nr:hypothetical protein [Candidatus Woesearchaeota archaeon]